MKQFPVRTAGKTGALCIVNMRLLWYDYED